MKNVARSFHIESELAKFIAGFHSDPLGFVRAAFPWGEPELPDGRTNPLRDKSGPEPWQEELLTTLGQHIQRNAARTANTMEPWRSAVAAGHGVGKSAVVSWIILFFMSTRLNCRGVVTAGTQTQLETRTWPELSKWKSLLLNSHWFKWSATSLTFALYPEERRKNYMFTAATVAEHKTEAFAGLHNEGGAVVVLFDEASAVESGVWEVADGATTDGEAFFLAFGNPTRAVGEFADCFDRHQALYWTRMVDSREVSYTNKRAIQYILDKYGADSDEAKVRVYGRFPTMEYAGFISLEVLNAASHRVLEFNDPGAPVVLAIDVARFGDDESVLCWRQGRDARSRPMKRFRKVDNVQLANIVMMEVDREPVAAIIVEGTGTGTGVIDILKARGYHVIEVHPGVRTNGQGNERGYYNRRAIWWSQLRDWLRAEGCIPNDTDLHRQLASVRYSFDQDRLKLEPKHAIRRRGLPSPDSADALALTFAARVARRDPALSGAWRTALAAPCALGLG